MLTIPPDTLNSCRSPGLMPARRRTLGGTTKPVLFFTVIVIEEKQKDYCGELRALAP
jgi:hypothetical protein